MPGRFIGHRGARDSEWSWERTDDTGGRGNGKGPFRTALFTFAFIGGLGAIAFGLFLILNNNNGDAAPPPSTSPTVTATPTDTVTSTPQPTAVATPTPSPTMTIEPTIAPTATPALPFRAQLRAWSNATSEWALTALDQGTSDYREGDLVPILLRIEETTPGDTYDLQIKYDCASGERHAFDFLAGIAIDDTDPLLAAPGPGRITPDSALIVPDDASLEIDDSTGGTFLAWGATFSAASEPQPQTACSDEKSIAVSLIAQADTVMLIWAGHLASSADWGPDAGAASAGPFRVEVLIDGVAKQSVTLLPGSVEP